MSVLVVLVSDEHKCSLFTLFLHCPLKAFCEICGLVDIPVSVWDKCQAQVDKAIVEAGRLVTRSRSLGTTDQLPLVLMYGSAVSCTLSEQKHTCGYSLQQFKISEALSTSTCSCTCMSLRILTSLSLGSV